MNIKDEQPAFSEWFDAVWLGDLEHGQRIPTIQDSDYGEYLEARQLAQGAWMHRAQIAATDVAVEKSWQRFEDKMAELEREKTVAAAPPPPVQQDGYAAGILAVATMIEEKAQAFADQHGSDDMGSLSFGSGNHAEAKTDYHNSLVELAEEVRAMIDAAPPPPAQQDDEAHSAAVSHLWQCLGRWSAGISQGGSLAEIAPTPELVDAVSAATLPRKDDEALEVLRELVEARDVYNASETTPQLRDNSTRLRAADKAARALIAKRGAA